MQYSNRRDGAVISSTPVKAAPNQELEIELEFGDESDGSDLLDLAYGVVELPPPNIP
ncbi:MAG TPA: hypothetical protein VE130_12925 [Nitrososphaeraceae archaeon]|nr:hypothetical protein [Nitrososphaeraceae archaeon]